MLSIILKIYDKPKYDKESNKIAELEYNIKGYDLICGGTAADKIEAETDANSVDDNHEYLVLHLENGETATFRNSHVDMFTWIDVIAQ
jgi:hypothetical protein